MEFTSYLGIWTTASCTTAATWTTAT